jgi:hypothetical protein
MSAFVAPSLRFLLSRSLAQAEFAAVEIGRKNEYVLLLTRPPCPAIKCALGQTTRSTLISLGASLCDALEVLTEKYWS